MKLTAKWANALTYVAAYLGSTVFVLVGGFLFLKSKNDAVKANLKKALFLYLIFLACSVGHSVLTYIFGLFDINQYEVLNVISRLISLASIATYLTMFILAVKNGSDEEAL